MRHRMFRVSLVAAACLLWLASAAVAQCERDGDVQFVCGPVSPEDLVAVPESPWVIVSGMENDGFLYATDTQDHRSAVLFPSATFGSRPDASYSSCGGPVTGGFRPHGLSLRPGRNDIHTLYVVRHGAREAIEVFEVDARGGVPVVVWVGCVEGARRRDLPTRWRPSPGAGSRRRTSTVHSASSGSGTRAPGGPRSPAAKPTDPTDSSCLRTGAGSISADGAPGR